MKTTAQFFRSNESSNSTQRLQNTVYNPKMLKLPVDTTNIIENQQIKIPQVTEEGEDSHYDLVEEKGVVQ